MSDQGTKPTVKGQTLAEVDRIRDIIFGPQMRVYEQQFKRMAVQLEQLGKQVESLKTALDQQQGQQESRFRELADEARSRHSELQAQLSGQLSDLADTLDDRTRQLASELSKQGQDLRAEFTQGIESVEDDKASRHNLGDLLVEMGTRLKTQAGLADLLGQLDGVDAGVSDASDEEALSGLLDQLQGVLDADQGQDDPQEEEGEDGDGVEE